MIQTLRKYPSIQAFFSTRHNGVSHKPFESLNLGFHVGDDEKNVKQNHEMIRSAFRSSSQLFYMDQVHSNMVCKLGKIKEIPSCDALLTDEKDKILMVMVADCVPLLFYDTKHHAIAAIHAGRAGAFENIVLQTFQTMQKSYGTSANELVVSIGPHIGSCCYEVGREIFLAAEELNIQSFIEIRHEKYFLDLLGIIKNQLHNIGVKDFNMEEEVTCTACDTENFFSYRKEGKTGRFCGVIMLK